MSGKERKGKFKRVVCVSVTVVWLLLIAVVKDYVKLPDPAAYGFQSTKQVLTLALGAPVQLLVANEEIQQGLQKGMFNPNLFYEPPLPAEPPNNPNRLCNMHNCFNLSRCVNGMKIYMYNFSTLRTSCEGYSDVTCLYYNGVPAAIRKYNLETKNPDEACLFLRMPPCIHCDGAEGYFVPDEYQKHLPALWNGGLNHVFIVQSDWEAPSEIGKGILVKENIPQWDYRPDFDVMFPLPGLLKLGDLDLAKPIAQRKILLSFMGQRYGDGDPRNLRNYLWQIDNGEDVIIRTRCVWFQGNFDERCAIDDKQYNDKGDLKFLLEESKFVINMPGWGRSKYSWRFVEILAAGGIPVVLVDDFILPFESLIEWRWCAVTCKLGDYKELPKRLRAVSDEELKIRAKHCAAIYRTWMKDLDLIVLGMFEAIRYNIENAWKENLLESIQKEKVVVAS
mmetsp:Transcript_6322/g.9807  ORF Transcript_6322/g.9807 Transcript_6322/m.9807 type:complete len:449 (+) Transcript_6322:182-1528(+)|eukprot:CAMPEP_0184651394 /NCGR_PEP_ID=MMETSP0308-20130426/8986_1 /TAXON_ID=38269 /ORGANISM="Gloeochaete witrockiana, Strain SAG 46.84" /LENGTH=448 /DNA_ID=CAMNT_0027085569 /DNA_START=182 /DNA_END=1528 /DNA_ORIENTATION=-